MNRPHRSDACLDDRTLATIAAGRCPIDQVGVLGIHLPRCARCRTKIALYASAAGRARGGDTLLLAPSQRAQPPEDDVPPKLGLRIGLVLLSLLCVGLVVWLTPAGANVRSLVERSLRPPGVGATP